MTPVWRSEGSLWELVLLPPCGFWGLNSACQTWWEVLLSTESFWDFFGDRVSLYSPVWLRTHYVVQAGLKLMVILVIQPPECHDIDGIYHIQQESYILMSKKKKKKNFNKNG